MAVVDELHTWLPTDDLLAWLQLPEAADAASVPATVRLVREAAAHYVERQRPDLIVPAVVDDAGLVVTPAYLDATDDVRMAGLLAAARLYARRSSPAGLASYGELGAEAVLRLDPDVARLLGTGRHARPRVG